MVTPLAEVCSAAVATRSSHARAATPEGLAHLAKLVGMKAEVVEDPLAAIARGRVLAGPRGALVVCGSLYLLADIRASLVEGAEGAPAMFTTETGR